MSLLTPIALFGLLILPLLVLLHLRRRVYRLEEVPSLLVWREVLGETAQSGRRIRLLIAPLLLLQLLAVALLVFSLARPESSVSAPRRQQVYIVDDSLRMASTDLQPTRLEAAKTLIDRQLARASSGTLITIVTASSQPSLLISSEDKTRVERMLASLAPTDTAADLPAALRLAAGSLIDPLARNATIDLIYAREEVVPRITGGPLVSALPLGQNTDNQAIQRFSAECVAGLAKSCRAYATVRNEADRPVDDPVVIEGDGALLAEQTLHLPPHSDTGLSIEVPAGRHMLQIYLARPDTLSLDNMAWCVVPATTQQRVTVVGDAARVAVLQRALAALDGVKVRVVAPARYTSADSTGSDLLVLDGWLPANGLPAAPALLLVDPPRLPGGSVGGSLDDATVSGLATGNDLLSGVDLTSLDLPAGAAERITLPAGVAPVVWAAGGPLLAAGQDGAQRMAVLAFDPLRSNITQLNAFPLLLRNLVHWSSAWLPPAAITGDQVAFNPPSDTTSLEITGHGVGGARLWQQTIEQAPGHVVTFVPNQPGAYTVVARGPWGDKTGYMAANVDETNDTGSALATPIVLGPWGTAGQTPSGTHIAPDAWWPWLVAIAILAIVVEWLYVVFRQEAR